MNGFKKFLTGTFIVFVTLVALYFSFNVFSNIYFNRSFYYAPNLVGLNIETAKAMARSAPIKILEVEREFSDLPEGTIYLQDPPTQKVIKKNRTIRVWVSSGSNDKTIPEVIGLNHLDAASLIETRGYSIGKTISIASDLEPGSVVATDPAVNSAQLSKKKVNLLISSASTAENVSMPDIVGLTLAEATEILQNNSLVVGKITKEEYEGIEPGIVIEGSLEFKKLAPAGTPVDLIVSK